MHCTSFITGTRKSRSPHFVKVLTYLAAGRKADPHTGFRSKKSENPFVPGRLAATRRIRRKAVNVQQFERLANGVFLCAGENVQPPLANNQALSAAVAAVPIS
jgi:hypothetical protein